MEFKELKCLIPRPPRPWEKHDVEDRECGQYLCDVEACAPVTLRFTCRSKHSEGHSSRIEFIQDAQGVITYREIPDGEKKSYSTDNGVRIPSTVEEVAEE